MDFDENFDEASEHYKQIRNIHWMADFDKDIDVDYKDAKWAYRVTYWLTFCACFFVGYFVAEAVTDAVDPQHWYTFLPLCIVTMNLIAWPLLYASLLPIHAMIAVIYIAQNMPTHRDWDYAMVALNRIAKNTLAETPGQNPEKP